MIRTFSKSAAFLMFMVSLIGCTTATTSGLRANVTSHIYTRSYDEVFLKAVDAVGAMRWQVTFTDKTTGVISAKTATNLWTWGEVVSIRVQNIENNSVKVDVSSGTSGQLVDWGRNGRNIETFYQNLDHLLLQDKK